MPIICGVSIRQVGDRIQLGAFPVSPGVTYAPLSRRHWPLMISVPVDQEVKIRIRGNSSFGLSSNGFSQSFKDHQFNIAVKQDDDSIMLTSRLVIKGGVVSPNESLEFAQWARAVDKAERIDVKRLSEHAVDIRSRHSIAYGLSADPNSTPTP